MDTTTFYKWLLNRHIQNRKCPRCQKRLKLNKTGIRGTHWYVGKNFLECICGYWRGED